ncbi:MAG: hypothetical protein AB7S38_39290 [Vulcanimicrobiota bacterium]
MGFELVIGLAAKLMCLALVFGCLSLCTERLFGAVATRSSDREPERAEQPVRRQPQRRSA